MYPLDLSNKIAVLHYIGYQFSLVHMVLLATDFLIILMSFAGQNNDISLLRIFDRIADRLRAVNDRNILAICSADSGDNVINDRLRLLISRIVRGDDRQIGQS